MGILCNIHSQPLTNHPPAPAGGNRQARTARLILDDSALQRDLDLRNRCVAGDKEACEAFVHQHSGLIYLTVQQTLRIHHIPYDSEDLKDLHHTVWLRLFEHRCRRLRRFRGDNGCRLASWVRLIAVRTVLNELRRAGASSYTTRCRLVSIEDICDLPDERDGPAEHLDRAECRRRVREAMERLSARDRLFCRLHFQYGLDLDEVADFLGLTMPAVYTLKHRVVQRLRGMIVEIN